MPDLPYDHVAGTVDRLVALTERTMPDCVGASVTLLKNREGVTVAASDDVAVRIDEAQYAAGDGPCLVAARTARRVTIGEIPRDSRWPEFGAAATSYGVLCSVSTPVRVAREPAGALNIYGARPHAFDDATDVAATFAAHIAAALTNAHLHSAADRLAAQLAEARRTRPVIERAKGILMAQRGCDADTAFALLAAASQRENVKVREIAERLVNATARRDARP